MLTLLQVYHEDSKSVEDKAVRHVSVTNPRHSSHTLSTAHASRTHVKAPQTDFPVKSDNSSGPTHDRPSERPSRTKSDVPTQTSTEKASRKAMWHQTVREPPKPRKGPTLLPALSHGRSIEDIRSDSMAQCHVHRSLQGLVRRLVSVSLSLERKTKSFFLSLSLSNYRIHYPYRAIYMSPHFEVQLVLILSVGYPHFECWVPSF